jgi:hypothetical protein
MAKQFKNEPQPMKIAIPYLRRLIKQAKLDNAPQDIISQNGVFLSHDEAIKALNDLSAKGVETLEP